MTRQQGLYPRSTSQEVLDPIAPDVDSLPPFQSCPNDLLLQIADRLDAASQRALSLVSRRFSGIVEEKLYQKVSLSHPARRKRIHDADNSSRDTGPISRLVRTLTKRPRLAGKVHHLRMYPVAQPVPYEFEDFPGIPLQSRPTLPKVYAEISEARLAGILLTLVPHLETLDFTVYDNWPVSVEEYPSSSPIQQLFKDDTDAYRCDLSAIPGLNSLNVLIFNSERFDWTWCGLPSLKHLVLGNRAIPEIPEENAAPASSSIPKLTVSTYSCIFLSEPHIDHEILPPFLSRFQNLRSLVISISDADTYLTDSDPGHFDNLVLLLAGTATSLEELYFNVGTCAAYLDFIHPVSKLSHFYQLRMLEISQDALIGPDYPSATPSPVSDLLPPSLERLNIWYPRVTVYDWFHNVLTSVRSVPCLKMVELLCTSEYGDRWPVINRATRKHPIIKKLNKSGCKIEARYIETTR